jgi:hypothetical protein
MHDEDDIVDIVVFSNTSQDRLCLADRTMLYYIHIYTYCVCVSDDMHMYVCMYKRPTLTTLLSITSMTERLSSPSSKGLASPSC